MSLSLRRSGDAPWRIGHRGAAMFAPENTIAAFAKAIELGANAIETDVCITQDDRFILWHDADPNDAIALARQRSGNVDTINEVGIINNHALHTAAVGNQERFENIIGSNRGGVMWNEYL